MISQKLIDCFHELKKNATGCILLTQVGAFMQVMGNDVRKVSDLTGLKLKMAGDIDHLEVIGGFPKSGVDKYVGMLVRSGHSVAIADQDNQKNREIREMIKIKRGIVDL
ncbi:hypothetical protein KKA14_02760 [bacterium]|nr:hypothetical protein [bacterium]